MSDVPSQTLTDQQARPLAVRGASVALSAGAGCGKTTVLTSRFLSELERPGGRSLSSIVALTFTDKAARELRGRIRAECRKRLSRDDDARYWRAVLLALEAAPVGTFHEFCGRWLRRHALEAGLDPDFRVFDASIAATVREDALARALRRALSEQAPDLILLAAEFGMRSVREALSVLLARRDAGALESWVERSPEEIVAVWRAAWEDREKPLLFEGVLALGRAVEALLAGLEFAHPKLAEQRATLLERLPDLARLAEGDGALAQLRDQSLLPRGLRKTHWPSAETNEAVKVALGRFRDAIDDYRARCGWSEAAALDAAAHGLRFARLALGARAEYARAKRERGGLDFDDLLIKTRDLLRAAAETERAALAGSIALLLVDEFQDTDPVQSEILRLIAGTGYLNGRLFVVGDFKQSIYRFRGAEPKIFQQTRAEFRDEGRHDLTENFRSVPGILAFVNALFRDAFAGEEMPPLVPGKVVETGRDTVAVEFVWASETDSETRDDKGKVSARDARRTESRWLARHLRRRIAEGRLVRDRETGVLRPLRPGDIALLFRAMTDVAPYETALRDEGLDYYTVGGSAFYVQQEINDLINVLSAIEDPYDSVGLAGALRGPFFGLSDDGLYWLSTAHRDLTEGIEHAADVKGLSDVDRQRAVRARVLLERWRGLKDRVPIAALIDRVLEESGYEAALLVERLGDRKRANARKLVRMARAYDRQGGFTLAQFVVGLRSELRDPSREEQAATTDETGDCVRLMSVHAAKGLEFPVVVLPDLNRKASEETPCAAFDPELGPLVRPSKERDGVAEDEEGLGWRIYRARERREEEAEALRLFYVATTRARDLLVLSAGVGPDEPVQAPALRLLDRQFDRACGLCRRELAAGWTTPLVAVIDQPPEPPAQGK
ncbi:MAG: UvrD-helicase domain-containing protein, partial [Isosphaeraceae bacterium]|nr:UvrD-helicase domain-containing protein [Isosphaeraceae bacterium]